MTSQRFPSSERSIHPEEEERLNTNFDHHAYHDSPTRDTISPPPTYSTPVPRYPPASASYTPTLHAPLTARPAKSPSDPNDNHTYLDDSPPPLPPPHRTDPTASTRRKSVPRKPVITSDQYDDRSRSREQLMTPTIGDAHAAGSSSQSGSSAQSASLQPSSSAIRSRGTSPYSYVQRPTSRVPESGAYPAGFPLYGAATGLSGSNTPSTPDLRSSRYSSRSLPLSQYSSNSQRHMASYHHDSPYYNTSLDFDPTVSNLSIMPHNIADDGDDAFMTSHKRKSTLGLNRSSHVPVAGPAAIGGAAGVAGSATVGGLPHNASMNNVTSTSYDPMAANKEDNGWLAKRAKSKKRMRIFIGAGIVFVVFLIAVGGIVGGIFGGRRAAGGSSASTFYNNADDDTAQNGDLNINSAEIKALLKNPNLHKVFPGMDYTPWGVQYPLCTVYPPSQNNVTRDMAVISQLTNTVRLYGNDCNQTEMVLHAIDRLQLTNMKLWLGVWIDTNQTTNARQISHMYTLLKDVIKDRTMVKGVIVGNEALFRAGETKAEARQELAETLRQVRANFTTLGYDLPIGTSDLGDNWDADLVSYSDFVMSNIHPFFAGVQANVAAAWTWNFWQQKDVPLTAQYPQKEQIIAETGWPSGGGTDCGGSDGSCAQGQPGAVASVDNMNIFMNDWVCQALNNGTNYFWFEAFDEPWKQQYNTPGKEWEDKWGLMDAGRQLKSGIKIPDCGGKTV